MSFLESKEFPPGAQMLKRALSYERFCLRNYYQALSQTDLGDKAIWERLIGETQDHVNLIAEALQVRYGVG